MPLLSRAFPLVALLLAPALAVAPALLGAQTRPSPPPPARCSGRGAWSAPTALAMPDGRPAFVEPGSAAAHPRGALVLGTPSLVWLGRDRMVVDGADLANLDPARARWSFTRAGFVVRPDGEVEPIDPPPAGGPMMDPSVRRARSGGYHVVWAQDTASVQDPNRSPDPDHLWHARLDVGGDGGEAQARWSTPVPIARGGSVTWDEQSTSQLAARGDTLVLAAPTRDDTGAHVLVAMGVGDTWRTAAFRDVWGAGYVAAGLGARGMPVLIVSGRVAGRFGLRAIELAAWTSDGGTWHSPVPLEVPDGVRAGEIRLAHLGGDSLLLAWEGRTVEGNETTGLQATVSPDGGRTWRDGGTRPIGGGLRGLRLLVDGGGTAHVVYVGSPTGEVLGESGAVRHVTWRDGRWGAGAAASSRPSFTQPLAAVTADGLAAIWGEGIVEGAQMIPRSYVAWWRPSCR